MLRSVCSVWLLAYRGAFVSSLYVFDWKACNVLALDGLLQPHSSIPSVRIGFSMVLYSSSEVKFEEADSKYFAKEKSVNLLTGCGSKQGSILFHCQCNDLAM